MVFILLVSCAFAEPAAAHEARLALLHGVPEKWNTEKNFETFLACLGEASAQNAEVFITPECWLDGYAAADGASTVERLRGVAQDLDTSAYLKRVASEARDRKMLICFGFTSLENGALFNSAGLWDATGARIAVYHKTHLQEHDLQFSFGEAIPAWDTRWGKVGIMICADRRWPETTRTLRLQGARLILNPTYGFHGEFNEAMMRTRSFENQCFIAFAHPQASLVTDPRGKVIAKWDGEGAGVTVCAVNLLEAEDDNHLQDRRPELYGVITAPRSSR